MTRSQVWYQAYLACLASSNLGGAPSRGALTAGEWADAAVVQYGKRFEFTPAEDDGHTPTIPVFLRYRRARANAITQEGLAAIRRAPRNDRPGMAHRLVQRLLRECVTITTTDPGERS